MADNTLQFQWIVTIKEGLERAFSRRPDVFVAGDLLWYPVEGRPDICAAPDAMVAIGRPRAIADATSNGRKTASPRRSFSRCSLPITGPRRWIGSSSSTKNSESTNTISMIRITTSWKAGDASATGFSKSRRWTAGSVPRSASDSIYRAAS